MLGLNMCSDIGAFLGIKVTLQTIPDPMLVPPHVISYQDI